MPVPLRVYVSNLRLAGKLRLGEAAQVDPMKPTLRPPGTKRLTEI